MNNGLIDNNYRNWLLEVKSNIKKSQIKASLSVNKELILLYWEIGEKITQLQDISNYGDSIIQQISTDLRKEFPDLGGFSRSNLFAMKQIYQFYAPVFQNVQQPVGLSVDSITQIPWGHNVLIVHKIKNTHEALFYINETIQNNWSRAVLEAQIETDLYNRQGKAINNFKGTLPEPQSDLAKQILKDPYCFNFLTIEKKVHETELERQLIRHITEFLLELGKGFAYMGRQFQLQIGKKDYYLDLLFYHTQLKCYVVIELKTTGFKPDYIGKLNFYLSAVDTQVKSIDDAPTIGMLLCKTKDNLEVEFALRDVHKPIGVSEFSYIQLPKRIKGAMPTIAQLENELFKFKKNTHETI